MDEPSGWESRNRLGLNGDIGTAGKALYRAMATAEHLGDIPGELTFGIWLANGMSTNGMADAAVGLLDRVETSARKNGITVLPIQFSIAKIRALSALPNNQGHDRAEELLKSTLSDARQQNIPGAETDLLSQAGEMAMRKTNFADAERSFKEQVRLAKESNLPSMQADGLLHLSQVYRSQKKYSKAAVAINEGIQTVRGVEESYDLPRFIAEKAEVEVALGHLKEADALYAQATHLIEGLLVNAPSSRVTSSMIANLSEIYLGHFRLAWNELHDGPKAFAIIESARGRALLGTLSSTAQTVHSQTDRSPAEMEIARLQSELLHSHLTPKETKQVLAQLDHAYDSSASLQPGDERRQAGGTTPVSIGAVKRQLAPGETLVEYVLDAKTSYAMEISASGLAVHSLPGRSHIDQLTKQFLSSINRNADWIVPAKALCDSLIPKSVGVQTKGLVVVPDGSLHSVPFGALVDSTGSYLSQTVTISSAPSASVYVRLKTSKIAEHATKPFLGIAYSPEAAEPQLTAASTRGLFDLRGADLRPLPFAREEVTKAAAILGKGAVVLDGAHATESSLKAEPLADFKVIHLAAHAVANEVEPDRAALVLAAGNRDEDGLWQAREIRRTRLNADVIVLSACETGVGRLQGEEGVMNLARTFLSSGAKSVVASLWSVEDRSTATIMESFYEHLAAGLSVSEALRQAQLDFMKDYGPMAKPSLWAGFEVIGDGTRRINFATNKPNNRAAR